MRGEGKSPLIAFTVMETKDNSGSIQQLFAAELQFRLAEAVRIATTAKKQPLDVPIEWTHGKHRVRYNEIALRKDQAPYAAGLLFHSATFLMATEIQNAIASAYPQYNTSKLKKHSDAHIRNAFKIARYIRNGFAHHPFNPIWHIDDDDQNKKLKVVNIIELDTTNLDKQPFKWRHYGGPLAILKLSHFVRFEILKDQGKKTADRNLPEPKDKYYQQGSLIVWERNLKT